MKFLDMLRARKQGCGIYGKTCFVIHKETYIRLKDTLELCMHSIRVDGDRLVGTFVCDRFPAVIPHGGFLPKFVNEEEMEKIRNIMNAYYRR